MQSAINFFRQIGEKRYLLYQLVKRDLVSKYVDSYLGLTWSILEPLATTVILSAIFKFGFKSGLVQDIPFFLYMFSGMVAFNFFSTGLSEGTNVIRNYSFLVKKVDFRLSLLPVVKNISCSIFHVIMVSLLIIALMIHGYYPSWYWFQFLYYFFAMNVLVLGVSWMTSAISIFVPDISRLISICLQFLFYLSPVFWSMSNIPEKWAIYFKFNPLFYIIQGYRDSFIYGKGFWDYQIETLYFWSITIFFIFLGSTVFRRLRPHFADVI